MRTTLTLDDELAVQLKELARRSRRPFKEVLNATIRRGLVAQVSAVKAKRPFRVDPFSSPFCAGVDPLRLNQLVDELEARNARGQTR